MVANHVKWYSKTEPDSTLWRWLDGQLGKPSTICNDLFLYANTVNFFALASQQKKKQQKNMLQNYIRDLQQLEHVNAKEKKSPTA